MNLMSIDLDLVQNLRGKWLIFHHSTWHLVTSNERVIELLTEDSCSLVSMQKKKKKWILFFIKVVMRGKASSYLICKPREGTR